MNLLRCYIQSVIAVLFCLSLAGKTVADEATTSPNFVIFYVDDLGWADPRTPRGNWPLSRRGVGANGAAERQADAEGCPE